MPSPRNPRTKRSTRREYVTTQPAPSVYSLQDVLLLRSVRDPWCGFALDYLARLPVSVADRRHISAFLPYLSRPAALPQGLHGVRAALQGAYDAFDSPRYVASIVATIQGALDSLTHPG